jgi:hypothetical protein
MGNSGEYTLDTRGMIFPSVFPLWWIALTALTAAGLSAIVLLIAHIRFKAVTALEVVLLTVTVGVSVLAGRLSCNVPVLNQDPIAGFSPNDFICPMLTFVLLEVVVGLRPFEHPTNWPRIRAVLVIVSFAVNVLTI